jgi:putative transposase
MFKVFKYRIYPNNKQALLIEKSINANRLVYNLALETKIYSYKSHGIVFSAYDLQKQLTELKKDFKWLREVDSQSLNQTILNLDTSYKNFFKGFGYPRFKTKKSTQSFHCPKNNRKVNFDNSTITVPKIYNIKAKLSRTFEGKIKTITISKTATSKYFASVLVEISIHSPNKKEINSYTCIGVDTGIKDLAILSNGDIIPNNKYLKSSLSRLKYLQRLASRKSKGSSNRKKANYKVALLHEKITNQRKDHLHKSVNAILNDSQVETIFIEDLNVKGMVKNHKLSQALSDASLGEFYRILGYKCEWNGVNLIKIGRFEPSSKRCFECGTINKDLKLSDRAWTCENGHVLDRDLNAARNIKYFGLSGQGMPIEPMEMSTFVESVK